MLDTHLHSAGLAYKIALSTSSETVSERGRLRNKGSVQVNKQTQRLTFLGPVVHEKKHVFAGMPMEILLGRPRLKRLVWSKCRQKLFQKWPKIQGKTTRKPQMPCVAKLLQADLNDSRNIYGVMDTDFNDFGINYGLQIQIWPFKFRN